MGISVMGGIQPRRNEMQCSGNDKKGVIIYIEKNRIRFHYDAEELWIESKKIEDTLQLVLKQKMQ